MHIQTIRKHQREQGYAEMQFLIETGTAWKMEGAIGRSAMDMLRTGACFLPKESHRDYYGNYIPSRDEIKKGTTGSLQNSIKFFTENQW
jgi:hypothetical protein